MNGIPEHEYAQYYWITLQDFDKSEWERFKNDLSPFTKLFTFDGIDDEEQSICFKFCRFVPQSNNPVEIKMCRNRNLHYKKEFIKALRQDIRGKVYFNVKQGIMKKL